MVICKIIFGITVVYIAVVTYLYLTSEMPDLADIEETSWE